jgi:putative lipoprotein (rSAM/lipoprotein system)
MQTHKHKKARALGIFSLLLAFLGVGCEELGIVEVMYGSPSAHFSVKGKVTDEQGNPIQNLDVSFHGVISNEEGQTMVVPNSYIPVKTDTKGTYVIETGGIIPYTTIQVNVEDTDGSANGGEFASDSLRNSSYTFIKDKKDKNAWSVGTADIMMPDIKLKKQ